MFLIHYECITSAGLGKEALAKALYSATDFSEVVRDNTFAHVVVPGGRVCLIDESLKQQSLSKQNYQLAFQSCIKKCWEKFYDELSAEMKINLTNPSKKTLILFSSTKGCVEDYVWDYVNDIEKIRSHESPFQAVVSFFENLVENNVSNISSQVISNACASSHVALELAETCLNSQLYDYVFVLAADLIGPFIYQGFNSLKVLTHNKCKPFDETRDGLQLGEAVALVLLAGGADNLFKNSKTKFKISEVYSSNEAGSVTRPSMDGECLYQLIKKMTRQHSIRPDLFLAHGTGTVFNDTSETLAFKKIAEELSIIPYVTGIKWSLGHTLGASGLLDTIAACEILKKQEAFSLMNTEKTINPKEIIFLEKKRAQSLSKSFKNIIVSSLGFGGIHAALLVQPV